MRAHRVLLALGLIACSAPRDVARSFDHDSPADAGATGGPVLPSTIDTAPLIVPPAVSSHASDVLLYSGYLDATLYGADSTGQKDSTAAIQSAINDAMAYALTTYLPSGTYTISKPLVASEPFGTSCVGGVDEHTTAPYGVPTAPSLVGPASGPRPTLQLASDLGAGNPFSDTSTPTAMLWFYNAALDANGQTDPSQADDDSTTKAFNCFEYAVIRDVNLSFGTSGNTAGAVGVQFYAAQYSYLENISVDATNGFAGFRGTPETEVWVNLAVQGGQYGLMLDGGAGAGAGGSNTVVGLTLKGQSVAGVSTAGANQKDGVQGAVTLVGFDIEESSAPGVVLGQGIYLYGQSGVQSQYASLIDGYVSSGSQPAIVNLYGIDSYLSNVYAKSSSAFVQTQGMMSVKASGGIDLINEYNHNDAQPYVSPQSVNLINGQMSTDDVVSMQSSVSSYPSDLVLRHLPGPLPWIADNGVVYASAFGADPIGNSDSAPGINAAIAAAEKSGSHKVFLPRGDYVIESTINMSPDTQLFGVPGYRSRIRGPSFKPTDGKYHPYINTANDANGHAVMSRIWIMLDSYPQNSSTDRADPAQLNTYAVEWQTGKSSIQNQLAIGMEWQNVNEADEAATPRKLIRVTGNGGGRWYGTQTQLIQQAPDAYNQSFRTISVDGTQAQGTLAPLTIYGSNPEHAPAEMYQTVSAANVRFLGIKTESFALFDITDSHDIVVSGFGANGDPTVSLYGSSTNICVTTQGYWTIQPGQGTAIDDLGKVYSNIYAFGLFKRGMFSQLPGSDGSNVGSCNYGFTGTFNGVSYTSPYPYCGDSVCDGAETGANCAADCGGSAPTSGPDLAPSSDGSTITNTTTTSTTSGASAHPHGCDYAGRTNGVAWPLLFLVWLGLRFSTRRHGSLHGGS